MKALRVGLTGGLACGKSTVARMFQSCGAYTVEADEIVHAILNEELWIKIISECFGKQIIEHNKINRYKLAELVFDHPDELIKLNGILHPEVKSRLDQSWSLFAKEHNEGVYIDVVPLLIEVGWQKDYHKIIVVRSTLEQQMERTKILHGWTSRHTLARIAQQMPLSEKIRYADFVIDNEGDLETLEDKIKDIWKKLIQDKGEK